MAKWNLLLALLTAAVVAAAGDACVRTSACECSFPDGTRIDLTNIFRKDEHDGNTFFNETKDNFTVYYHGCVDVMFNLDYTNITGDKCRDPANICVFDGKTRVVNTLAQAPLGQFTADEHGSHMLTYKFLGRTTTVKLSCTPEMHTDRFLFEEISKDGNQYTLQLFSKYACRTALPHVLSTGSKLLIMFFTFLLVYFIGGALLAYFVRGARGRELIPNVDFWTSLPGLVKDGVVFVISGCSTRLVTTAETYDQI